ncbi:MAG: hypothetical protein VCD33_12605 [Alphaproteobacteria bacterium]|jgi:hypothetical protein
MAISQYHLNYSRDEDRIYIFVRDSEVTEHAFGLTRQLFKKLWPVLGKTVQDMSKTVAKAAPEAQKDVLQMEQEGAVSDARQDGSLSNKPLPKVERRMSYLVKTIRIRNAPATADGSPGGKILILTDGKQAMNIPISHDRLIVFCDALKSLVASSDWDIKPLYPWEEPADDSAAEPTTSTDGEPTRH